MKMYLVIVALDKDWFSREPSFSKSKTYLKASHKYARHILRFFANKSVQLSINSFFVSSKEGKEQLEYLFREIHGELFYDNFEYLLPNDMPRFFITEINQLTYNANKELMLSLEYLIKQVKSENKQ